MPKKMIISDDDYDYSSSSTSSSSSSSSQCLQENDKGKASEQTEPATPLIETAAPIAIASTSSATAPVQKETATSRKRKHNVTGNDTLRRSKKAVKDKTRSGATIASAADVDKNKCRKTSKGKNKKSGAVTANELLADSENEDEDYKGNELNCYLYRRVAKGYTKQNNNDLGGSQYIDLKIYNCNELEHVKPKQRWRKSIVTLKTKISDDTPAWGHLVQFMNEVKIMFNDMPTSFGSTYDYQY